MKKFLTVVLSTICIVCFSLFFVGCNNENDNNNSNNEQIVAIYNTYVAYAESNGETPLSYEDWFASIKGEKGETGANGVDGVSPKLQINATTNMWEISYDNGETWTSLNVKATGSDGINGTNGQDGQDVKDGEDGTTPTIEIIDGYWYINGENSGVKAEGKDGVNGTNDTTPTIEIIDGYWYINGENSGVKAEGKDGVNGTNGQDGLNGKSAYEIYLQAHPEYTKSEQEWLDDLINGRLGKKENYTVSFNTKLDNKHVGTIIDSQEITENGKVTKPNTPVLLGYEFLGWYYEDTDEPWSFIGYSVTENMTLTAKWQMLEEMQDYTFTSTDIDCTITKFNNKTATEVVIPTCVTSIGNSAFYGCDSLIDIEIPDSVTSIGDSAFFECLSLSSVTIGSGVTSIGKRAFYRCDSLASITVAGNNANYIDIDGNLYSKDGKTLIVYAIGKTATEFAIPNNVTSINSYAFYHCDSLINIEIPDNVTSIGEEVFANCSSLTSITVDENNANYMDIDGNLYEVNDGGISLTLIQYAIGKIDTNFNVPYAVTSIGAFAFAWCRSLTSVTISNTVTSIGNSAFYDCRFLASVTIGNNVKTIGYSAFAYCKSLTNIEIPDSVTNIDSDAFYNCSSLTSVTIGNGVKTIDHFVFNSNILENIQFNGTVEEWNAIKKGSPWKGDIPATFVQCIDGQVAI